MMRRFRNKPKGKDMEMEFKSQTDFPESCPPSTALPNDRSPVYRFIVDQTIEEIDFLNHKERNLPYPSYKSCEALAISFYTSTTAVEKARKRFKNLKEKKCVEGRITSQCGIHTVENEHLNLWLFKNVDMLKVFQGEGG